MPRLWCTDMTSQQPEWQQLPDVSRSRLPQQSTLHRHEQMTTTGSF